MDNCILCTRVQLWFPFPHIPARHAFCSAPCRQTSDSCPSACRIDCITSQRYPCHRSRESPIHTGSTCQPYSSGTVGIAPGRIWPPRVLGEMDTCHGGYVSCVGFCLLWWERRMTHASIRRKLGRTRGAVPASAAADGSHVVLGLRIGFNRSPATHVQR